MNKVAVIYYSKSNVTAQLAQSLMRGLNSQVDMQIVSHQICDEEIVNGRFINDKLVNTLIECDGVIFGSPTYMGNASAQFKSFADATSNLWCEQKLAGKLAAGFTCGSAMNGNQGDTLQYFTTLASQHGMLWLGLDSAAGYDARGINRLGYQQGVVACSPDGKVDEVDLATAFYLGSRFAEQLRNDKNNVVIRSSSLTKHFGAQKQA